jgi:hypothetical protein
MKILGTFNLHSSWTYLFSHLKYSHSKVDFRKLKVFFRHEFFSVFLETGNLQATFIILCGIAVNKMMQFVCFQYLNEALFCLGPWCLSPYAKWCTDKSLLQPQYLDSAAVTSNYYFLDQFFPFEWM